MNVAVPAEHVDGINGIALAAGVAGLELGISLALPEYRTVCWAERDAYAAAALVARMEEKILDDAPVWSDVTTFDGGAWRGKVDILSAGYPCQPFSLAGKRKGKDDPRHLWPHVRRILSDTAAPVLFVENVPGHVGLGLEAVRNDLLGMGYAVEAGIFSAAEVGASHIRQRLFILAYADGVICSKLADLVAQRWGTADPGGKVPTRSLSGGEGMDNTLSDGNGKTAWLFPPAPSEFDAWDSWLAARPDGQPALSGEPDGMANRMDRYRLAGNGVCPLAAGYAFASLVLAASGRANMM